MTVREAREDLERQKGAQQQQIQNLSRTDNEIKGYEKDLEQIAEAQAIIQTVSQATQKELEFHIADLVSLALEAVFPDPYSFYIEFTLRRGKSEADLLFSRSNSKEEIKVHPLLASGGGPSDVASFALRVALWSLERPRNRGCLVLDEPFKFLSRGLQERASRMVADIAKRLKIQFIIVTHEETLIEAADRVFEVTQKNGISKVEVR